MSTPIERIAGYACEVNEEQWRELVKVADEVKSGVWSISRVEGAVSGCCFAQLDTTDKDLCLFYSKEKNTLITYPDFLKKLKGEEKWEPKNGDEVEVRCEDDKWHHAKFVGMHEGFYVCRCRNEFIGFQDVLIRPLRPTITRAEAEHALGKRIVD